MFTTKIVFPFILSFVIITGFVSQSRSDEAETAGFQNTAESALRQSLAFMKTLQRYGGWAMAWTSDRAVTVGEHAVKPKEIITVQPPATPGTAGVYLRAYRILGNRDDLETAMKAGDALIVGQLNCGGFPHEFVPGDSKNRSGTFDDDVTQAATRFLIDLWKISGEKRFEKAARRCARFMLDSQYENGGWPQAYPLRKGYSRYITINDDAMQDVIRTLILCYHTFDDQRYYDAALRGADCLLASQGTGKQAGWPQQWQVNGEPAPARRFEPVALTTAETVGVLRLLLEVYRETGDKKYLKAGPPCFEWLKRSQLPNGRWARFYEYKSNRPIYCTQDGTIIFDVSKARPGYGWQGNYFDTILEKTYKRLMEAAPEERFSILDKKPKPSLPQLRRRAEAAISQLDRQGRWLSDVPEKARVVHPNFSEDVRYIQSSDFVRNAHTILDYLEKSRD